MPPIVTSLSLSISLLLISSAAQTTSGQKPRVFISDSQSWEMSGNAGGANGTFAAHSAGGARPQTAEIIKTFGERCPGVITNNKPDKADYVVLLDHEGGKGLVKRDNKMAVFNKDGDSIVSHSTRSLGNAVKTPATQLRQIGQPAPLKMRRRVSRFNPRPLQKSHLPISRWRLLLSARSRSYQLPPTPILNWTEAS